MDLNMMYKYAKYGVIEHIKILHKLCYMCVQSGDYDAADEYAEEIEKSRKDFDFIISAIGLNKDEQYDILNWEIERSSYL